MPMEPQPLAERTKAYALRIIRLYTSLPKTDVAYVIGRQLLRSGTSVGANYREGKRARSASEMTAKFGIRLQELEESGYWLELLIDASVMEPTSLKPLLEETLQLNAIFTTSVKKISANRSKNDDR
jgi:four helix bundle protein